MKIRDQVQPQQRKRKPAQESSAARCKKAVGLDLVEENRILELARGIMERRLDRGEALTDPTMAGRYFQTRLRNRDRETFAVMLLDTRHRMLAYEELFHGTIDGAEVHPREVARAALTHNAAAVLVAHNHPSGNAEPSAADRAVTARLKQALALLDIRLLDHFVIADGPPVSMAARGWV